MKKIIAAILFILCFIFIGTSCQSLNENSTLKPENKIFKNKKQEVLIDTFFGLTVSDNELVYVSSKNDGLWTKVLSKCDLEGKKQRILFEDENRFDVYENFLIDENYIYCQTYDGEMKYNKYRIDTSGKTERF